MLKSSRMLCDKLNKKQNWEDIQKKQSIKPRNQRKYVKIILFFQFHVFLTWASLEINLLYSTIVTIHRLKRENDWNDQNMRGNKSLSEKTRRESEMVKQMLEPNHARQLSLRENCYDSKPLCHSKYWFFIDDVCFASSLVFDDHWRHDLKMDLKTFVEKAATLRNWSITKEKQEELLFNRPISVLFLLRSSDSSYVCVMASIFLCHALWHNSFVSWYAT